MITYLTTAAFTDTVETYLATWGRDLHGVVNVVSYDDLFAGHVVRAATVVFSDLERLTPRERSQADEAWLELAAVADPPRLLNRPASVLSRTELLQTLHARGLNEYTALPLREAVGRLRHPVFIRHRDEHWGSLTPLLADRRTFERAISRAFLLRRVDELLAVEFLDTADCDGVYRKYAAFVIGDRITPRHLVFDVTWSVKVPRLVDAEKIAEERTYLTTNPHREELLQVAGIAGIDYGRIDYGLRDGKVQVWEINTNPIVMMAPHAYEAEHMPNQEWFAARIEAELRRLDGPPASAYSWTRSRQSRPARRRPRQRARAAASTMARSRAARRALDITAAMARPWIVGWLAAVQRSPSSSRYSMVRLSKSADPPETKT